MPDTRLPLRLALAAVPLWMTLFVLAANIGWLLKLVVALTFGVTLAAPAGGLLLVAAAAPLGDLIAPMVGYPTFRVAEVVVVAFLAGWLTRGVPDRRGPRLPGAIAGALLATAIVASIAGLVLQLRAYPAELAATVDQLTHIYYFVIDRLGVVDGARLIEGMGLAAATVVLFRRHPALASQLPAALAAGAAAAALSSLLLWRGIGSATALERYHAIGYRVSGHVADVNAAGSYFALIVCLALGMALRERGMRAAWWLALTAASGLGLWFTASRSAMGAAGACLIVAALWAVTSHFGTRARAATFAIVILALLGGAAVRARLLQADPDYRGVGFREQFNQTSARMIGARPLFGVGAGQYNRTSPLFLSPQLAWTYGAENAHNYFLQVAGELGLAGFALFLIAIGAPLARAGRALARAPRDWRLLGAAAGAAAFLISCATGHPFLVSEVAYPFWIQFGLMAALAGSTLLNRAPIDGRATAPAAAPARSWLAAAAAIVILVWSPLNAAAGAVAPPASQAVDGFYPWETLADGTRFRWTEEYASLFVPAGVTRVEIPVRLPTDGRSIRPMGIEVMVGALPQSRTMVDATWAVLSVRVPDNGSLNRFKRVDLRMDRVWQPALYIGGSADMRRVGVQVGEPRLIRE